jgi:hypothetical protein
MAEKGGGPFFWVVQAGYLDLCESWEACERLTANWFGKPMSADWFGNPSTLWNHPCGFTTLARG